MTKNNMDAKGTGTILSCIGGIYSVDCSSKIYKGKAKGTFKNLHIKPVAGDECEFDFIPGENDDIYVTKIYDRTSLLNRPSVANLDTIFITFSPTSPKVETLNVDKQIFAAIKNNVKPVLLITKYELDKEYSDELYKIYSPYFKMFLTSSNENIGTDELKKYIEKETHKCAFSGPSGVGKSTLINMMFPQFSLKTGELSKKIQRGKNTTRETTLFKILDNHYICDTPGFTSFDVFYDKKNDEDVLYNAYPEISKYKDSCLWRNCTHTKETGCAILDSIKNGLIDQKRYDNYIKIRENIIEK